MNVSSVSSSLMNLPQSAAAREAERAVAVMSMAARQERQQGADLVSLIQQAAPASAGVGTNLSVYA
jgi:hypothetical protein